MKERIVLRFLLFSSGSLLVAGTYKGVVGDWDAGYAVVFCLLSLSLFCSIEIVKDLHEKNQSLRSELN